MKPDAQVETWGVAVVWAGNLGPLNLIQMLQGLSDDGEVSYLDMLVPHCMGLDLLSQVGQDCCEVSAI